jgi:hypothetical protein
VWLPDPSRGDNATFLDRSSPQVLAVDLDQIERAKIASPICYIVAISASRSMLGRAEVWLKIKNPLGQAFERERGIDSAKRWRNVEVGWGRTDVLSKYGRVVAAMIPERSKIYRPSSRKIEL